MPAKQDVKERIIEAGMELFCAKGFHAVSTQELCEKAGVLKGTLYHFFSTKSEVAVATLQHYGTLVQNAFAQATSGRGSPARRLVRIFDAVRQSALNQKNSLGMVCGCLHGNLAMELTTSDERVRKVLEEITQNWADTLVPTIQELIDDGSIPECDPNKAARTVLAFLAGTMLTAKTQNNPGLLVDMGRSVVRLLGGSKLCPKP